MSISNQGVDFNLCENNNYLKTVNAYLESDITLRKNRNDFINLDGDVNIGEHIRFVNIAFAYAFNFNTLSETGEEKLDLKKHVGHISTNKSLFTNRDGDLLSYFDKIVESQNETKHSPKNQILIDNSEKVADRGEIKGHLPLKHIFSFCKTFTNFTKFPGCVCAPGFIPDPSTQTLFNESIKFSFKLTFNSWNTVRGTVNTGLGCQLDKISSNDINFP